MPSLSEMLQVYGPGGAGYYGRRQMNEQASARNLEQAGALQQMIERQRQAQVSQEDRARQEQYRSELQALGPNPSQEQLTAVASKYSGPKELLTSQTASLDRKAQIESVAQTRRAMLDQQGQNNQMQHEFRLAQIENMQNQRSRDLARDAENARHNRAQEGLSAQNAALNADLKRMGIEIQQQGLDLRRDLAATKQEVVVTQKAAAVNNISSSMDRLASEANRLLKHPGLPKVTGLMSIVPLAGGLATVPGTDAANFKAGLETLKSQAGFSVLQAMREASKTGGALGQVSDFENRMLQANLAALDTAQSEEEFRAALQKIITYTEEAKGRLQQAGSTGTGPAVPKEEAWSDSKEQRYQELLRKRRGSQ